ncbi:MAG TPA: DUF3043 domain-containing protein [Streptosporangiaceae bacterium]
MLRRRRSDTAEAPDAGATGVPESAPAEPEGDGNGSGPRRAATTAGKGRPTPKRSESEHRRRQPYNAPKDRKEANRAYRERERTTRARRGEALRRGEEWALPARDRGPVRALARDFVDSRRRVSEFYMYGLLVLMVLLFVRSPMIQTLVPLLVLAAVLVMAAEGILLGRRVRALVEERLPGESTRGVRLYAAMRALQIRQLRMPKPRIKPGDSY